MLSKIRVALVQPSLAQYRIPVFRELAQRENIKLHLYYGSSADLPNKSADSFEATAHPIRRFGLRGRQLLWHMPQWKFAAYDACDVLILPWDLHYLSLMPALWRARRSHIRTILWGHGYTKKDGSITRSRLWTTRFASGLMLYNHGTAQRYIHLGVESQRVFVALNSLDQTPIIEARKRWESDSSRLGEFRQQAGLEERPVVLYCSRLLRENRCDMLLQAVQKLKPKFPDLCVVLIGDGEDREPLKQLAVELGLQSSVIFTGALYEEDQLAPYFLSASAFCYPENIGLSLLHAFGYSLPVITSDALNQQNPEIEALINGENGLLYSHRSIDSLTATLDRLLSDTGLQAKLRDGAAQTVADKFTLSAMVDGMESAIKGVMSESPT